MSVVSSRRLFSRPSLLIALLLAVASTAHGGDLPQSLEAKLITYGLNTDTPSVLVTAKTHPEAIVRLWAIQLLEWRKDSQAEGTLLAILETESDCSVRAAAATALAELGNEVGKSALRWLFEMAEAVPERLSLAWRLARAGDPTGYPEVEAAAESTAVSTRQQAPFYLAYFVGLEPGLGAASRGPVEALATLAGDASAEVRKAALAAFGTAASKGASVELLRRTAQELAESDPDSAVREQAKLTLGTIDYWLDCRANPLRLGCPEGSAKWRAEHSTESTAAPEDLQ